MAMRAVVRFSLPLLLEVPLVPSMGISSGAQFLQCFPGQLNPGLCAVLLMLRGWFQLLILWAFPGDSLVTAEAGSPRPSSLGPHMMPLLCRT